MLESFAVEVGVDRTWGDDVCRDAARDRVAN
jgi:hypothetical protein